MVQRRRRKSKKWIYWLLFFVLLIVAGVVCYFVWNEYFNDTEKGGVKEDAVVEEVDVEGDDKEESEVVEEEKEEEIIEKEKVIQYEGDDPNEAEELTGVVTYAGVSGSNLIIRVNIDQFLNGGNCELNLLRNGQVIYGDTASVIGSAATATCEGFNVPVAEVGNGGVEIVIKISSEGRGGTIRGEANI